MKFTVSSRNKQREYIKQKKGWETRRELAKVKKTYCCCIKPKPTQDTFFLKAAGTVQCGKCGRAIFDENNNPVRTLDT